MRPGGPDRSEVLKSCLEPGVHMLGEIVMGFANLELFVEAAIWHLLKGRRKNIDQMSQAVTVEMSFDRKVHAFATLYTLRYPAEANDPALKQLIKDLFIAQEQRNGLMHSAWSYSERRPALHRMKGSARAGRGLVRMFYVVTPERLEDVRVHIASVGARFGQFTMERVQARKRRRPLAIEK
jgi:hypothetical protein